jgi:hypothetical protein
VDVGNREKGAEDEDEDILALRVLFLRCCFILSRFLELFQRLGGWVKKKGGGYMRGTRAAGLYSRIPALELGGS